MNKKAIALCTALCACVVLLLACGETPLPAYVETGETTAPLSHDTLLPPDTESDTEAVTESIADTETTPVDTDRLAQMQVVCDQRAAEIEEYIKSKTPVYKREIPSEEPTDTAQTDDIQVQYEEYVPEVAYCYMDLESGVTMGYNSDKVMYSASLIKLPYVFWALKTIEAEMVSEDFVSGSTFDPNRIFTYQEENFREGSGIIQNAEFGTQYTYLELLRLTITKSDNIAFYQLRKSYGTKDFLAYCESVGVTSPKKSLHRLNANECIIILSEIYDYFQSGSEYAAMLRQWMLSTNHRIMLPYALKSEVANKYGWDLEAYHDMGVVFHDHPYVLAIMTGLENGSSADNKFIREIAKRVEAVHEEINSVP